MNLIFITLNKKENLLIKLTRMSVNGFLFKLKMVTLMIEDISQETQTLSKLSFLIPITIITEVAHCITVITQHWLT